MTSFAISYSSGESRSKRAARSDAWFCSSFFLPNRIASLETDRTWQIFFKVAKEIPTAPLNRRDARGSEADQLGKALLGQAGFFTFCFDSCADFDVDFFFLLQFDSTS